MEPISLSWARSVYRKDAINQSSRFCKLLASLALNILSPPAKCQNRLCTVSKFKPFPTIVLFLSVFSEGVLDWEHFAYHLPVDRTSCVYVFRS